MKAYGLSVDVPVCGWRKQTAGKRKLRLRLTYPRLRLAYENARTTSGWLTSDVRTREATARAIGSPR